LLGARARPCSQTKKFPGEHFEGGKEKALAVEDRQGLIDLVGRNDDLTLADPFELTRPIASFQVQNHYLSGAATTSRSPPKRILTPMRATQI
jgi:hypothetical protein